MRFPFVRNRACGRKNHEIFFARENNVIFGSPLKFKKIT